MRLVSALRVRNTKNRNRLKEIERRGGLTEDQSKSSDRAYSKYEAMLRRPQHIRVRIGSSRFVVNKHLLEKRIFKYNGTDFH